MASTETQRDSLETKYLSKRVLVNGQFVTLYSVNGQTWLSSPEEIPELMARLDNARIMLATPEKAAEGDGNKDPKKNDATAPESNVMGPKLASSKYRLKGPKPRPILRQGGVVITGTPVEPISASNTVVRLGGAEEGEESSKTRAGSKKAKPSEKKVVKAAPKTGPAPKSESKKEKRLAEPTSKAARSEKAASVPARKKVSSTSPRTTKKAVAQRAPKAASKRAAAKVKPVSSKKSSRSGK